MLCNHNFVHSTFNFIRNFTKIISRTERHLRTEKTYTNHFFLYYCFQMTTFFSIKEYISIKTINCDIMIIECTCNYEPLCHFLDLKKTQSIHHRILISLTISIYIIRATKSIFEEGK